MVDVKVTNDLENKKLILEWEVNAPKDKVWRAYADKDMFEKWWGPEGWETTVKEFNFVSGGRVHYDMHCIDVQQGEWFDQHSWGLMVIENVDEPNSFTYKDYFSDENAAMNSELPALTVINDFIEVDGGTRVVGTLLADTAEQIEELIKMGMIEGFTSQLQKLDQLMTA